MPEGTWKCSKCGQIYSLAEPSCSVCHLTRENRHIIGRIEPVRSPKPPPETVEVPFPFFIKEARFNLPLDKGAVWSSGTVVATADGFFLLTDKDGLDGAALAEQPPAAAGPVGPLSIFVPRSVITRIVHHRLTGEFMELNGRQKIPLRLSTTGWGDLDVICDQLGINRS
ncbi:MAG: hypothetical protein HY293_21220 [Planctomycetes bacterium]|nr:hypothetical protein [Planctomycetota bacterium]